MSFKKNLEKTGKWVKRHILGGTCKYCLKNTTRVKESRHIRRDYKYRKILQPNTFWFCGSQGCQEKLLAAERKGDAELAAFRKLEAEKRAAEIKEAEYMARKEKQRKAKAAEAAKAKAAKAKAAEAAKAKAAKAKAAEAAKAKAAEAAKAKAAAEKRAAAKKKAEEARVKRESETEGMVNAGIPRQLVDMWVSGELEKSDMFLMLKTFDEDLPEWCAELVRIIQKSNIPRYFSGELKENITMLKSLISDSSSEMVRYTFQNHSLFDKQALEFVQKCQTEDHLYPLYLEILERDFDIEFAYKLVNDFGFNEHPEALKEVIDGANWEAVAVKHGFLQF